MNRRAALWLVAVGAVLGGLHVAGSGPVAPPPLEPAHWAGWAGARDPLEVAAALLRLLALVTGWWLVASSVLVLAARAVRWRPLGVVAERVTPALVRRALSGTVGLSVGLSPSAAAGVGATTVAAAEASPPPTMVLLDEEAEEPPTTTTTTGPPTTATPGPPTTATPGPSPVVPVPPTLPPAPPPRPPSAASDQPGTATIGPGDHLWAVAERVLTGAWGRAPAEEEVVDYWRSLVAANRMALADPANPDLVFPGQVVRLPPAPAVPT